MAGWSKAKIYDFLLTITAWYPSCDKVENNSLFPSHMLIWKR